MTATDLDLDALLDALAARALERAAAAPLINAAGDEVTPYAATGRLIVNPGDVIASVWGNTTFDQTVQAYDTAASRDAQWPTPKDGAVCYTVDAVALWLRRAGAWVGIPAGWLAGAVNATTVNCGSASTTVMSLTYPAVTNRHYRVDAIINGNQASAAGSISAQLGDDATGLAQPFATATAAAAGQNFARAGFHVFKSPSTRTGTVTLYASTSAGTLTTTAGYSRLEVSDLGAN